jgi:glyoxylase-like metal-dependent hydrolase (beta-lactamase superfamily II)
VSDIDLIVLTHLHPDHTAGVEPLRQFCKAPVAASITPRQLAQGHSYEKRGLSGVSRLAEQILPGTFHHLDPFPPEYTYQIQMVDIWLEDGTGLPNHSDWRVIASPGHTPESLCLYNPFTYELLCGDTGIGREGPQLVRGRTNRHQLQEMLQMLRSLRVYYLYPGHGRAILSTDAITNLRVE